MTESSSTLQETDPLSQEPSTQESSEAQVSGPVKTKNQIKNEEKMRKYLAKQAEKAEKAALAASKPKKEKAAPIAKEESAPVVISNVAKGEKKDFTVPMASAYHPIAVEATWNDWWEAQGFYQPDKDLNKEVYVIPIPPPNVTGSLHLGHALTISLQDTLIRYHRMMGKSVLYLPGCDHAGIATQMVVEKKLYREQGLTRHALGREAFLEKVWEWKQSSGDRIYEQLKRLGASLDWSRARFTMDASLCEAVNEAFVRLFDRGVIYRAERLVNWCGKLKTALSDAEVDHLELQGDEMLQVHGHDDKKRYPFGFMLTFAYELEEAVGDCSVIHVSTTRPETILGDVAVAVHPQDERYKALIGKRLKHPFIANHFIPVIADDYADPAFGTGCVKITPAHDFNDYAVAKRHGLKMISILNEENLIECPECPELHGLKRFDARVKIMQLLKEKQLFISQHKHAMTLPICSRSGDIIEPRLTPQWWMACQGLAEQVIQEYQTKRSFELFPHEYEKQLMQWLENIQDWCISRQLWWGHRIPAYRIIFDEENENGPNENWVVGQTFDVALNRANLLFPNKKFHLEQDPDVLDTWFSSSLWPFSTLGWPNETADLSRFYPASVLETGRDILFFWVIRMLMMGLALTGETPFKHIYLHAMIRDAHGRKMSKSLGNVIDPIDVMQGCTLASLQEKLRQGNLDPKELKRALEGQVKDFPNGIPECGTDALRFALCAYTAQARDINLNVLRVEGYRRFCNKLWNATRFVLMKLDSFKEDVNHDILKDCTLLDHWILKKLDETTRTMHDCFKNYGFVGLTQSIYDFWLYHFCDVYIEAMKGSFLNRNVLVYCLERGLLLLHPLMPFVTEELYQRVMIAIGRETELSSIMIQSYPLPRDDFLTLNASRMDQVLIWVKAARSLMNDYHVLPKHASLFLQVTSQEDELHLKQQFALFESLTRANKVELLDSKEMNQSLSGCVPLVFEDGSGIVFLLIRGVIQDWQGEVLALEKRLATAKQQVESLTHKLATAAEYEHLPLLREQDQLKCQQAKTEVETLEKMLENFKLAGEN